MRKSRPTHRCHGWPLRVSVFLSKLRTSEERADKGSKEKEASERVAVLDAGEPRANEPRESTPPPSSPPTPSLVALTPYNLPVTRFVDFVVT